MLHSRRLFLALFLLFAFLVACFPQRWFRTFRLTVLSFLRPANSVAQDVHGAVSGSENPGPVEPSPAARDRRYEDLLRENAELRESTIRVHTQNVELSHKLLAVTTLVRQGFRKVPRIIEAGILISGDASDWHSTFLIDRGSKDGIEEGQPVVWGRHLVGKIVAVGPYLSRVRAVVDPAFRARAMVAHPPGEEREPGQEPPPDPAAIGKPVAERLLGVLEGDGGAGSELMWILTEEKVATGDLVVTVEENRGRWPAGLLFGTVVEASTSHGPYYRIRVQPGVDVQTLAAVFVLKLE